MTDAYCIPPILPVVGGWQRLSTAPYRSDAVMRGADCAGRWEAPAAIVALHTQRCVLLVNQDVRLGDKVFVVTQPNAHNDYMGLLSPIAMRGTVLNVERQPAGPFQVEVEPNLFRFL